jgi:hypothetical protein
MMLQMRNYEQIMRFCYKNWVFVGFQRNESFVVQVCEVKETESEVEKESVAVVPGNDWKF